MTRSWPRPRLMHIGIALGTDGLTAVLPGRDAGVPWTRALQQPENDGTAPSDLAVALGELRAALCASVGVGDQDVIDAERPVGVLHMALLPPFGHLRRIALPGLSTSEARQVLRREPSRYLPLRADGAPLEVEVEGDGWRRSSAFTFVAAARALVDGIHAAARESGWRVEEIVPAEAAWAAGATSLLPHAGDAERALAVCLDDRVLVLRVRDDRVLAVRRLPVNAPEIVRLTLSRLVDTEDGAKGGMRALSIIGDSPLAAELRMAMAAPGQPRHGSEAGQSYASAAEVAARFATRAAGPTLAPESESIALQQRTRRLTLMRFVAASLLIVAAAGTAFWGSSRERSHVMAERARIRAAVDDALVTRDSLAEAIARVTTLRSSAASSTKWSALIASLSDELPDDAFVVSLHGGGDTLRLEGSAARATEALSALTRVRGVRSVRPEGPIRQVISEDGSTSERFTLSAVVERTP